MQPQQQEPCNSAQPAEHSEVSTGFCQGIMRYGAGLVNSSSTHADVSVLIHWDQSCRSRMLLKQIA